MQAVAIGMHELGVTTPNWIARPNRHQVETLTTTCATSAALASVELGFEAHACAIACLHSRAGFDTFAPRLPTARHRLARTRREQPCTLAAAAQRVVTDDEAACMQRLRIAP
jgi:hypothetical protein